MLKLLRLLFLVPEAGQRKPARQEPGGVSETPIQIRVELSHLLVQQTPYFFPM